MIDFLKVKGRLILGSDMLKKFLRTASAVLLACASTSVNASDTSQYLDKIGISDVSIESSKKLPQSAAAQEDADRYLAFDRDTASGLSLFGTANMSVTFTDQNDVHAMRVYGTAPYSVKVFESASDKKPTLSVDLTKLDAGWNTIELPNTISSSTVYLEFKPKGGSDAVQLSELEFLGAARVAPTTLGGAQAAFAEGLDTGAFAFFEVPFDGTGVVLTQEEPIASSSVTIDALSTDIRNAWLSYEVKGDAALVALGRSLNGYAYQGGYPFAPSDEFSQIVEQIDPTQLQAGVNNLSLALGNTDGGLEVQNLSLIVEYAQGSKIATTAELADVLDGDPATVTSISSGSSAIEFDLAKAGSLSAVMVELSSTGSGQAFVDMKDGDVWYALSAAPVELTGLSAGSLVALPIDADVNGALRVRFEGVELPFSVSELRANGAEVGPTWGATELVTTWPSDAENYGNVGIIRGYISQPQTTDGAASLFAAGLPVELSSGAFEVVVSREQAGFGATDLSEPWAVELRLVRPDGTEDIRQIAFDGIAVESDADEFLPEPTIDLVTADAAATLSNSGAVLEIAEQSVEGDVEVSITPLIEAEIAKMDLGLTNVTKGQGNGRAFRMLPSMKFKKNIKIKLEYDETLIPAGYSEDDVKIYFFDEEAGRWVSLTGTEVNKSGKWLRANTDHFTDFIAGVVVAPESPQTASFNPTQIQGIKAADPSSKINLIEAPSANNMGDANLSYPIELPAGRLGMAPSLQVAYSSAAQNGWMGLGWNLNVPEITIDTRWGVPRYDAAFETETYSFNGQMLTPVAHRAALVAREADREFHTRVEGGFQKIIRHGTSPANYWFEVIDKMGTRYAYGGDLDSGAIDVSSALLTGEGNVFRWKLTEVRDTNGNFVKYHYGKVASTGLKSGSNLGKTIYPERITYTGHNGVEGDYEVLFTRDRELAGFVERKDTIIDGRGGFKQVTADLLRHIEVRLNGTPIRAYEFTYDEGAYYKTLLQTITQYGADGTAFNTHSFDYHDDTREADGSYKGFAPTIDWSLTSGDVSQVSALQGANTGSVGGFGLIGLSLLVPSVENAVLNITGKFGSNKSDTDHLIAMIDINGDGLADKVYKNGSQVFYRRNLSEVDGSVTAFDTSATLVANLPRIGKETYRGSNKTVELFIVRFNAGLTWSDGTAESQVYFSDVNGDGLVDLVNGSTVLFNSINSSDDPVFTANVNETPYPIPDSAASSDALNVDLSETLAAIEAAAPLIDTVVVWEAPYNGSVQVTSDVALVESLDPERASYESADGVRVAIQLEGSEVWSDQIAETDYASRPANVGPLSVSKGDKLYFRVQSNYDGAFDVVSWDPAVEYVGVNTATTDANGLGVYAYDHSSDFTTFGFGNGVVGAPKSGTVQISGTLNKTAATTDDVVLELLVNGIVVDAHTFASGATGSYSISEMVSLSEAVIDQSTGTVTQDADTVELRLSNDSRIDAAALSWDASDAPFLVYTSFDDGSAVTDDNGEPILQIDLFATLNLYAGSNFEVPAQAWVVPQDGLYTLTPELDLAAAPDGDLVLTYKSNGALVAKETVGINGGVVNANALQISLTAGEEIWFEYADVSGAYLDTITEARVLIELPDPNDTVAPIDNLIEELFVAELHSTKATPRTGEAYRGWSRLGYDGTEANQPISISEADLEMPDQAELEALGDDIQASAESGVVDDSLQDAVDQKVYNFKPDYAEAQWSGPEEQIFAAATDMGSSRLNLDFPEVPDPMAFVGARGVPQISTTSERNIGIGFTFVQANRAKSTSKSILDYQDMNGDQFPDILSQGAKIQYTMMLGHLDSLVASVPNMENNPRVSRSDTTSIGGSKPGSKGNANGNQGTTGGGAIYTPVVDGAIRSPIGFSATLASGDNESEHDLRDMNADGLPDIVKQIGSNLAVRYNIGYEFLPNYETLGATGLNIGENSSLSIGLGFNSGGNSISAGGNIADSSSRVLESLNDVNGDGLLDAVHQGSGNTLTVLLNSGSGFESPIIWSTGGLGSDFAETDGKSAGIGGSFTACPGFLVYFCVGAGVNAGDSTSWTLVRISDLNGDGDPDLLRSNDDGELRASYGTDGRTNMLRTVNRPMGATIAADYARSGNTYDQPSNRWVLSRVEVYDGFDGDGSDRLVSTFAYADGKYDRQEREFYGFETVVENHLNYVSAGNESVYRTITQTFDNDSYYSKGLLLSSVTTDGAGNKFLETANSYTYRDIDTGTAGNLNSLTATIFPQLSRTDKAFFEGQSTAGKETYTTFDYDFLGNVTRFFDAANLDTAADDVESLIAYHNDTANYIVGKADSVVVNGNGTEMRRRTADFEIGTGNLLEVISFNTDGTQSVSTMGYNGQGNLISVQGAENANGQRYGLTYTFDTEVETYVTETVDSFGYSSSAEYDFRFGEVIGTTDINAQAITNTLDEFGRVVTITGPYQSSDATITFAYNPRLDVPNSPEVYPAVDLSWALTQHIDTYRDLSDPIETVLFADGLGRVLQTKKDATIHVAGTYTDKMVASGRVNFDFVGRQIEQFYPVEEALGAQGVFNASYDAETPTTTTYDILDRPLTITIPDGSSTAMVYDFGPDRDGLTQFRTLFTDAEGKQRETYADVRGLMTSVKEMNPSGGQPTIWTSYVYDPLKQITDVTDDQGNVTTSAYDNLGRQIEIDSPDMGLTTFTYDPASNLIAKQTANLAATGTQIDYTYDFNRLMAVTYPEFTDNNITYTYGAPGAAFNSANRITSVQSQAGFEERFYGPLGETVKTILTVSSDTGANPETYATEYTYDTWNRLQTMVYPDGEILVNAYDSGGKLITIDGTKAGYDYPYLKEMGYDKFGQRVFTRLGNDTTTNYTYTADTRRLDTLQTLSEQTGRQFQDMTYGYDLVGNIVTQANLAENTQNNLLGGATSYTYEYDDLYRLIGATGSWSAPNNPESFTLAMSYDTIHNIASKTQEHLVVDRVQKKTSYDWTYGYNGAQPHAPTDIGDRTYSYDANGNQTGWDSNVNGTNRTITWDEENRIQSVADNGATTTYKYNDAGERVFKVGAQGETVYVNQFYVIRNGQVASKHIFGGSQRLVSKLASQPVDAPSITGGETTETTGEDPEPAAAGGNGNGNGGTNPNAGGANSNGQGNGAGGGNAGGNGNGNGNGGGGSGGGNGNGGGNTGGGQPQEERDFYFYHPDHLGSSSYVTDIDGEVFQHTEYFPFGETWVQEQSNSQRTPYLFTGKELDEDTQLYYFGARYYDPRTSVWQSPDPILKAYLHGGPNGGVYEPLNLSLYSYARQHPVNFSDPNGELWGAAAKLLKIAIKGGDVAATFAGAVQDTQTIFSSDATIGERLLAAGSLATEIVSPVSARDAKAGYNAASNMIGGADDAADAARAVNRTDDAADISRQSTREIDDASTQLQRNREAGDAWENEVLNDLDDGTRDIATQVTIRAEDGTNTRIDIITREADGTIRCIECKASETAPLTRNQGNAFPQIEVSGGEIRGAGKPGFEGGMEIPPTQVEIIRPPVE